MGLSKEQKQLVKAWVAAGLKDQEIIHRAKEQIPPFHISQQNISKNYRKHTERRVRDLISQEKEDSVLRSGLALKENRIRELEKMYHIAMEQKDRSGNKGNISQARGCLDDIAKELGERKQVVDVTAEARVRDIIAIRNRLYGDK